MLPQAQTYKAAYIAAHVMTFNADVSFLGLSENKASVTALIQEQIRFEANNERVAADEHDLQEIGHFFEVHDYPVHHALLKGESAFIVVLFNSIWHNVQILSVHASFEDAAGAMDGHISKVIKEPITESNRDHLMHKMRQKNIDFSIQSCPIISKDE